MKNSFYQESIKTNHPKIFRSKEPYIEIEKLKMANALDENIENNDLKVSFIN